MKPISLHATSRARDCARLPDAYEAALLEHLEARAAMKRVEAEVYLELRAGEGKPSEKNAEHATRLDPRYQDAQRRAIAAEVACEALRCRREMLVLLGGR